MASLVAKKKGNQLYYYVVESARVEPRIVTKPTWAPPRKSRLWSKTIPLPSRFPRRRGTSACPALSGWQPARPASLPCLNRSGLRHAPDPRRPTTCCWRRSIASVSQDSLPPGYERKKPVKRPKLGPWLGIIDQILVDGQWQPKKQRHTARRIWDRLKVEHGLRRRLHGGEVFVPLAHPPGDAQVDFGEALVVIGGIEQKAHFQCMDLPHADDCFVVAFPTENTQAFGEGHNQAVAYFEGAPRTILYDHTRMAVRDHGQGERKPTEAFGGLQSHYLFAAK